MERGPLGILCRQKAFLEVGSIGSRESLETSRFDGDFPVLMTIIFTFTSLVDRQKVLQSGPWFILGRYLHLRPWSKDIQDRREFFGSMPVWICLPNPPLHFWCTGSISRIAYVVGKPVYLDEKSAIAFKLQFIRVCVEVSADNPFPKSVLVEVEGDDSSCHDQIIEYEMKIKICTNYYVFRHSEETCDEVFTQAIERLPVILIWRKTLVCLKWQKIL